MKKLEGYDLIAYVNEKMSEDLGVKVEYNAVVFNSGIHLDTYIKGGFFEKRVFSTYEEMEAFMYEVLENLERPEEVTNDDRMEAITMLSDGLNKRDNVKDAILDLEAIISLAQGAIHDLEEKTMVYDDVLKTEVSLKRVLDELVYRETNPGYKDLGKSFLALEEDEARLYIVKHLASYLNKYDYELKEGGF